MVAPAIAGALIGAGANVIGGIASHFSGRSQASMQKRFAKRGISWRVKDAKRAGLHPLYALGAQVPSYSPVSDSLGESLSAAGQNIGSAIAARMTPIQKKLVDLELAQAEANLNKTYEEQAFIRSERLRNIVGQFQWLPEPNAKESGSVSNASVFGGQAIPVSQAIPPNYVTPKAPDLYSHDPRTNTVAGVPKGWRGFEQPSGLKVYYPTSGTDLAEAKESVFESLANMLEWYSVNARMNPNWNWEIAQEYMPPNVFNGIWNIRSHFKRGWEGFGKRVPRYDYIK